MSEKKPKRCILFNRKSEKLREDITTFSVFNKLFPSLLDKGGKCGLELGI